MCISQQEWPESAMITCNKSLSIKGQGFFSGGWTSGRAEVALENEEV